MYIIYKYFLKEILELKIYIWTPGFLVWHVRNLDVATPIDTKRKKLNKLKINNS